MNDPGRATWAGEGVAAITARPMQPPSVDSDWHESRRPLFTNAHRLMLATTSERRTA
jgi:hypothetical protein